jgi:hypothetical protein
MAQRSTSYNGEAQVDCSAIPEPSKPATRSTCRNTLYNAVTFLALLMATASFCLVVVLYSKCNRLEDQLLQKQAVPLPQARTGSDDREICFPCDELSQEPFEEDNPKLHELIRYPDEVVMTCCARTRKQTSLLFELVSVLARK